MRWSLYYGGESNVTVFLYSSVDYALRGSKDTPYKTNMVDSFEVAARYYRVTWQRYSGEPTKIGEIQFFACP